MPAGCAGTGAADVDVEVVAVALGAADEGVLEVGAADVGAGAVDMTALGASEVGAAEVGALEGEVGDVVLAVLLGAEPGARWHFFARGCVSQKATLPLGSALVAPSTATGTATKAMANKPASAPARRAREVVMGGTGFLSGG